MVMQTLFLDLFAFGNADQRTKLSLPVQKFDGHTWVVLRCPTCTDDTESVLAERKARLGKGLWEEWAWHTEGTSNWLSRGNTHESIYAHVFLPNRVSRVVTADTIALCDDMPESPVLNRYGDATVVENVYLDKKGNPHAIIDPAGCIARRLLDDGRQLGLIQNMFNYGLGLGYVGEDYWRDYWEYVTKEAGFAAMLAWNPDTEKEPTGWVRHVATGRRRFPDGDPATEEIRP